LVVDQDWQVEQIGELTQGLRDRDHFDAWKELATEAGMIPKAIRHAWQEVRANGFETEQDEVDRKALGALMDGLRSTHDYFWPSEPKPTPARQPADRESEPAATAASGSRFLFDRGAWRSSNGSAPPGIP